MTSVSARMSSGGRLVIPAQIRRELGLEEGVAVRLIVENASLTVRTIPEGIRQAQAIFAKHNKRPGVSIVDEFIAERRAEALREELE